jgi:hypothetical protein
MPEYEDLPFTIRPDLSPYLVHLTRRNTKKTDGYSAFENLVSILQCGRIWGSTAEGYIIGGNKATCFMDVPLHCLKYVFNKDNTNPEHPRYEPFGVLVHKKDAIAKNCRPVLYLSNNETERLHIPKKELWRVVRFEVTGDQWISWIHEREWRCEGDFNLLPKPLAVLVKNTSFASDLAERIAEESPTFKAKPRSIIPLTVLCQGLTYLKGAR